jgi:hypothetical protein
LVFYNRYRFSIKIKKTIGEKTMKKTTKLVLVISLLGSIALAGDMTSGNRLCGDMTSGTKCSVSPIIDEKPIDINDEKKEDSKNIIFEWFDDFLEELFN